MLTMVEDAFLDHIQCGLTFNFIRATSGLAPGFAGQLNGKTEILLLKLPKPNDKIKKFVRN